MAEDFSNPNALWEEYYSSASFRSSASALCWRPGT